MLRIGRQATASAILLAALLRARGGAAEEHPKVALRYAVPDATGCPDEASFRNLVAARLGYDPFVAAAPDLVRVEIVHDRGALRGRMTLEQAGQAPSSARQLSGQLDQCGALDEALATTLAIAVDPVHALAPSAASPPPRSADAASPASPETPPAPSPPPPVADARRGPALSFLAIVGGVASIAEAPGVTLGGDLGFGVGYRAFSIEASGRGETTPGYVSDSAGDRLQVSILSGAIAPCANVVRTSICAIGRIGVLEGYTPDVTHPGMTRSAVASIGVRLGQSFPLGAGFAFRPSIEGALPLVRTQLVISGAPVWTSPIVSASANLALTFKIL